MIKRALNLQHTLIKTGLYPSFKNYSGGNKVLLGIGGNIGDVIRRFHHLFWYLERGCFVRIVETSAIVKNPPFGYTQQDDFYNALILIETRLSPKRLMRFLLRVEKVFGRKRLFKDGPRTLDIDMIFYEDITMQTDILTLPHPQWDKRASVLIPLATMKKAIV